MNIRIFSDLDHSQLIALWEICGLTRAWNNPSIDIFRKQGYQNDLFLVADTEDGAVIGSVMGGYDGHRGWVNYLAVHPDYQHQGIGKALMTQLEQRLIAQGCPKIQLLVRKDNTAVIKFYEKLDYTDADVFCLGKRLIED